jgi:hypothetical protein
LSHTQQLLLILTVVLRARVCFQERREHVAVGYSDGGDGGDAASSRGPVVLDFHAVGRLPSPLDNVAICGQRVEAGTKLLYEGEVMTLEHTMLEGHRYANVNMMVVDPAVASSTVSCATTRRGRHDASASTVIIFPLFRSAPTRVACGVWRVACAAASLCGLSRWASRCCRGDCPSASL